MNTRRAGAFAAAMLACTALLGAGCGESKRQPDATSTQAARGVRPAPAARGAAAQAGGRDRHPPVIRGAAIAPAATQRARRPRGAIDDEIAASGARPADPCALVDRASAQAIVGVALRAPVLAPQGPTCIYAALHSKMQVTLAVLTRLPAGPPPQRTLSHRMRVRVGGRHAWCGVAGAPTLVLALARGRFISVGAPCPIAAAFAARALSHLPGR